MGSSTLESCLTQRLQVSVLTCLLVSLDGDRKDRRQVERTLLDCTSSRILLDPLTSHPQVHRFNVKPSHGPSWRPDLSSTCPLLKKRQPHGEKDTLRGHENNWEVTPGREKKSEADFLENTAAHSRGSPNILPAVHTEVSLGSDPFSQVTPALH